MEEGETLTSFNLVLRSRIMRYISETYATFFQFVLVVPLLRTRLGVEGYFFAR